MITKLKSLRFREIIDYFQYRNLYPDNYSIPIVYALIKVHKSNSPARLICPYFSHPLSKLAKFLSNIMNNYIRNSRFTLKDSAHFSKDIKKVNLNRNDIMISLDIVNLFTNIPIRQTIDIIKSKLENNQEFISNCKIPIEDLIELINFCMVNTSFSFDGKFYTQKSGAPMGSNLSPIIAEALVSSIFEQAYTSFNQKPKFLRFFVDDSFIIINKRYSKIFLDHINSIAAKYETIKFTIEEEKDGCLPFLDLLVSRANNKVKTTVYRKPTHSNRYLNFKSHHSMQNKKSVIRSLVNRAITHTSDENDLVNEINHLKHVLIENNYPEQIIRDTITSCMRKHNFPNTTQPEYDMSKLITIPYYKGISEKIREILQKQNIKTVFTKGITIKNLLTSKNRSNLDKSNVVYKVNCNDCPAVYVGTTKRKLSNRISEHKNALFKPYIHSNVAEHAFQFKHDINFNNPEISYIQHKYSARKFLESIEIKKHKLSNKILMNDPQNSQTSIPQVYLSLLK